jgi:two-component SAPR family response regulator
MANFQSRTALFEEAINPFEVVDNSEILKSNLEEIDNRDIRCKFKATEDPIQYVFDSFEVNTFRYLVKPISREDLENSMTAFINNSNGIVELEKLKSAIYFATLLVNRLKEEEND